VSRINVSVMAATAAAMSTSLQSTIRQSSQPIYSAPEPIKRRESSQPNNQGQQPIYLPIDPILEAKRARERVEAQRIYKEREDAGLQKMLDMKPRTRKVKVGFFSSYTITEWV
jgi:hypothetical protein